MSKYNVREIALDILLSIEKNQAFSNLLLNKNIEKYKLSGKDAGLLTEIVYGTIQRKMTLDYYLQPFVKNAKKMQEWVRVLLRLSAYQFIYLDRVPEHAVIYEAVEIAKKRGHKGIVSMVNGVLRNVQRQGVPALDAITDPAERLSIETSHPLWLVQRWISQYGMDKARSICETTLQPPKQTLRVNTARFTIEEAVARLAEEGIEVQKGMVAPEALEVQRGNAAHTQAFKDGYFTVQDESSMLVAHALGANEGDHVLDSCAAPGGKTTHIAEKLYHTGQVTSLDIHDHKVKLISEQVERLQLPNVTAAAMDSRKVQEHFEQESFDKILVDAPCSGFGVMRRKPDLKYTKSAQDIVQLSRVQLQILEAVEPLLKQGGTLVYSTCTMDREENKDVVEQFLQQHPHFEWDDTLTDRLPQSVIGKVQNGQLQLFPDDFQTDGFYIACLRKKVQ
jgi:16S rRNA (cytosine967-C5)-methyltransferase